MVRVTNVDEPEIPDVVCVSQKMKKNWTPADDDALRQVYPGATCEMVQAAFPGRTWSSIHHRASRLGIPREYRDPELNKAPAMVEWQKSGNARRGKFSHPIVERDGIDGKICRLCKDWKPLTKFSKKPDCAGGRRTQCTTCEGRWAYANHREKCIRTVRNWQRSHPEAVFSIKKTRHGRLMNGPGVGPDELAQLKLECGGLCVYCMAPAETFDHVVPIAGGGEHSIENLLPACNACNQSKGKKSLLMWLTTRKQRQK